MQLNNGITLLYLSQVTLYFRAIDPIKLRKNSGSAFRGLLGKTFKDIVCTNQKIGSNPKFGCAHCVFKFECTYAIIFLSYNPGTLTDMKKPIIPHPYIIELPDELVDIKGSTDIYEYKKGDFIKLNLMIVVWTYLT